MQSPSDLELLPGVAEAVARLNGAGFDVAICINQPEVARGVLTQAQLDDVHEALRRMLASRNAKVDMILCCGYDHKCPRRKPSGGMLREALAHYHVAPADTPFVGDQADDLKAAFHAGCKRVLVRTGLGSKTLAGGPPEYRLQFTTTWPPWSVRSWRQSSSRQTLSRARAWERFSVSPCAKCRPC